MTASNLKGGDRIVGPQGQDLVLVERVHAETRSRRWRAHDAQDQRYDILLLEAEDDPGPLLGPEVDTGICGWEHEAVLVGETKALIFREDHLRPLANYETDVGARVGEGQWQVAVALGELFEMLHVIGDALVVHATMEAFALKELKTTQAVMKWPELLHRRAEPPRGGSFVSTGLNAPEVTGEIVREVDERADVYMLGALLFSVFSGQIPTPGMEKHTHLLPRLRAFNPEIPVGLDACVRRALSRLPEDRFESVEALMKAARAAVTGDVLRELSDTDGRVWINHASHTEIGRTKRQSHPVNQDAHLSIFDPECGWGLFAVMDGVSRCEVGAGELASWVARNTLEAQWYTRSSTPIYGQRFTGASPYPGNLMDTVARLAHEEIVSWLKLMLGPSPPTKELSTPCTTLAAVAIFGDRCVVTTVGDSPVFLVRFAPSEQGFIEQLTVDQTGVLEGIRSGMGLTQSLTLPNATWLENALGKVDWSEAHGPTPSALKCDTQAFRLLPGDLILVTSDGVPDSFAPEPEREILRLLQDALPLSRGEAQLAGAVRSLLREANERGGRDNMTAILVSVGPNTDTSTQT